MEKKEKVKAKKILYIEDNRDTAEAVKIILDSAGFETELAFTGRDGLRKVGKYFDLILLDIMLPDMSGWDVFTKLKKINGFKYVFLSVIPVSAERMRELKKAGVSDYITKPFKKSDLIARLNKVLK
jgi:DNA-binding response OmpR family regulator